MALLPANTLVKILSSPSIWLVGNTTTLAMATTLAMVETTPMITIVTTATTVKVTGVMNGKEEKVSKDHSRSMNWAWKLSIALTKMVSQRE